MRVCNALNEDLPELKKMWQEIFQDTPDFCDFAFSLCDVQDIFVVKDGDSIASMLIAGINVTAYEKKGYYIYGVCTKPEYRKMGCAKALIENVCKIKEAQGYDFGITQPATKELFAFYEQFGFTTKTYLRRFEMQIKRCLWSTADFDTVTVSRFKEVREKFKNDEILHFTPQAYEKFTEFIYKTGGSTAESKNAFAIYFVKKDTLIIRELSATSTSYAQSLMQAIAERTGVYNAHVELCKDSVLFLGEGKEIPHCSIKGLDQEVYANLMFD